MKRMLRLFGAVLAVIIVAPGARAQAIDTTHHDTVSSRRYLAKGDAAVQRRLDQVAQSGPNIKYSLRSRRKESDMDACSLRS